MKKNEFLENDFEASEIKFSASNDATVSNKTYWGEIFQRISSNKVSLVSFGIILFIIAMAIVSPLLSPYTYKDVNTAESTLPPRIPIIENLGIFNGERNGKNLYLDRGLDNVYHYFGTDKLGRDIFTRVAEGTRISLIIAGLAVIIDIFIGVLFGVISGYFGGWVDTVMQRVTEILSGIPTLVVVTLLLIVLKPGLISIIIALILTGWINMSRIVRSQVLKLKNQEYVLASKTLGASSWYIILKDMLPNTLGQIVITFMFSIPNAIFLEAFLSFIGLGVPAPLASLGSLINDGYKSAMIHPYIIASPVVVLGLLMLCFNLFADGLRDAIDPQMKQV